jgi:hypothetical protein
VISTRRSGASNWRAILDRPPIGEWELSLKSNDPVKDKESRDMFKDEEIDDILFVVSCSGRTPKWPV